MQKFEFDEACFNVSDRVMAMIQWLLLRHDRVTQAERLQLTFDCAGGRVSAEVKERETLDPALLRS